MNAYSQKSALSALDLIAVEDSAVDHELIAVTLREAGLKAQMRRMIDELASAERSPGRRTEIYVLPQ